MLDLEAAELQQQLAESGSQGQRGNAMGSHDARHGWGLRAGVLTSPAPPMAPLRSASASASESMIGPRATVVITALSFISANSSAPNSPCVSVLRPDDDAFGLACATLQAFTQER